MLIQHPAVLSENMVSLYFFLSPQRCRISHRRQCASLLHWNLTIPPSLWPDRELRKYHCPCLALAPPPVAIRHLLLRNRYRPDGLHGVQSMARPNRNVPEEWVFSFQGTSGLSSLQSKFNKNPPVSRWPRRRTLVVLAGLHMVCFDFFSVLCSRIGAKKYLVGFPTRHRRRFYLIRLHIMHPKICFTKFAWFFPERLNWSYAPSAWIISISISGAVMTFTTSIFCSYALLNRNSSLRESKIRITEICLSNPFRKYYA